MGTGLEYLTLSEKLIKIYKNIDKIKSAATKTSTEMIYNLIFDVYIVVDIITIKIDPQGYYIIEFDKDHYIEHTYIEGGMNSSPKLIGPSSDKWDNETGKMLDDFLLNKLDKLELIGNLFMF